MTPTRVFDFLYYQQDNCPLSNALNHKEFGQWNGFSTAEVIQIVNDLSLGMLALGLKAGDKTAIVSPNRPEWNFIDFACQQIGVVTVPMYPTITIEDYEFIFEHAEVKMIFAADQELMEKVKTATASLNIEHVYSFDQVEGVENWKAVKDKNPTGDLAVVKALMDEVEPEDLLTIIYTSGTTGRPKGVMLSHNNIVSNTLGVSARTMGCMNPGQDRTLSFLPMCHIYERTAIYVYFYNSLSIYYAESMDAIGENIKEVSPQMFTCVPRLLEKVYDKIVSKGYELPLVKRKLFFWAIDLGLRYDPNGDFSGWYHFKMKIARKLIFSKWREALGGQLKLISSGAAALQPRLARIFWAAEIPVCEGYGLTETSPVITATAPFPEYVRMGAVGKLIDHVQVKIADDGEILCKGPNVMMGYYKAPELTAEVIQDGWFHTGDIGVVEEGFLRITDRKKEMFKTSGGKYIAPQLMENKFKESIYIEQIMVVGEGRKFPSALIVPNFEALKDWQADHGITSLDTKELIAHPEVLKLYQSEIARFNEEFGNWEQIKKFELVETVWGIDTGELTPTLKLKRRIIKDKFKELIEGIYMMSS
ncbi:long-chain acyl-CoA synthetase [Reichenbachiella faecimaris]|uniref:Long-chain acyl-CoA synthetase n=1 Tax=Reichenbachiella faecimaris TaxID=692418 RepID=A0A1W2GBS8_REIFA|nr:long-chain fatty acid--CoA ligase [Reichenbachiella faecimaris]SMD34083.1 long-chain acyl-CoA synthetase [Reichenbachiella faecimaris]